MEPETNGCGVPICRFGGCSEYDGMRCRLLGCHPETICEPAVKRMAEQNKELLEACEGVTRFADLAFAEAMGEGSEDGRVMLAEESKAIPNALTAVAKARKTDCAGRHKSNAPATECPDYEAKGE